jgi:hypothetical protein
MKIARFLSLSAMMCAMVLLCQVVDAQAREGQGGAQPPSKDYSNSPIVTRMMAFDKKHDGKLTKDEVTDERLHRLFDRADANGDGVVTKEELMALAAKMDAEEPDGGNNGPGGRGGPGGGFGGGGFGAGPGPGPGGPGGRGRGARGGGGAFGGPPRPGQILPPMLQDTLNLTPEQRSQVAELQKQVDAKLASILNEDQKRQMKEFADRGPGGRRGPGGGGFGAGGPGGPGAPPPPPPPDRPQ